METKTINPTQREKDLRMLHLSQRIQRLVEIQGLVATSAMGDYLTVGGETIWLNEEETFSVINDLIKLNEGLFERVSCDEL